MNRTNIGWCDYTWNPATGCKHGCEYCYARKLAETRLAHIYPNGFEPTFWESRLDEPNEVKGGRRIFVVSMGDLFGEWVPDKWIEKVLNTVEHCPQHTFQFLTKNPIRYKDFVFPKNTILGTTITNKDELESLYIIEGQKNVDKNNIFVSFEPLLGEITNNIYPYENLPYLDWIIIGAQTGKNAKQPKLEWVMNILLEANKYEVPVFIKDNLDWNKIKPRQFPEE